MAHSSRAHKAVVDDPDSDDVRIDKWLWAARLFKTRALAAEAIAAGRVKLAGERVKTSHHVKLGERYSVTREGLNWSITVTDLSDRRGNAEAASKMYSETEESVKSRLDELAMRKAALQAGVVLRERPTKRNRRLLEAYARDG